MTMTNFTTISGPSRPRLAPRRLSAVRRLVASIIVAAASLPAAAQAPATPPAANGDATLVVGGDIAKPLSLTLADIKAMPRTTVTIGDEGSRMAYEGVLVGLVLQRAGAPLGRDFSGKAVASYVLATAKDGYQVVFSLGELDPAVANNEIIIADTVDGKPLFDYQGPFRLVAPHDKRGVRGIRMLQRLEVVRLQK
jgi:DMSO/TMAO reductase YedYZ molybdopterin-dependent catalytic subunit